MKNKNITYQKCSTCKNIFMISEFYKDKTRKSGYATTCKYCSAKSVKKYEQKNKDKNNLAIEKKCTKCKEIKDASFFNRHRGRKDGLSDHCKECNKKYREKNKKYLKQKRIENNEKRAKRIRERRKNDTEFCLSERIKSNFIYSMKTKKQYKNNSFHKYTSFEIKDYIEHLKKDILWDEFKKNKTDIHIDHIIPISIYNFLNEEDIKRCWNPFNLRLIESEKNMEKHNKIDMELIKKHKIEHLLPENFKQN